VGIGFVKCYIDDIIFLNLTLGDHMHHLQEVFIRFKEHNFTLHLGNVSLFIFKWNTWVT
jgi:hypothetical protein